MNKIYVKSIFNEWKEVSVENATEYVKNIIRHASNIPYDKKYEYINKNKIKGITVEELLEIERI